MPAFVALGLHDHRRPAARQPAKYEATPQEILFGIRAGVYGARLPYFGLGHLESRAIDDWRDDALGIRHPFLARARHDNGLRLTTATDFHYLVFVGVAFADVRGVSQHFPNR